MISLPELLRQGSSHAWLFAPSAVLLGALHGLEPGHSKTMMAGFIVAIRGTVRQAVLLGLAATLSHTIVVWLVALAGMRVWQDLNAERLEPYLQVASAALMIGIALWMIIRLRAGSHAHHHKHGRSLSHSHGQCGHDRSHDIVGRHITTGQIIMFGLTGGLVPCPAAITVLLICLQLQKMTLGVTLVLCFSIGLAVTMTAAGVIAALSLRHIGKHLPALGGWTRYAPCASSLLIILIGLYIGYQGLQTLLSS